MLLSAMTVFSVFPARNFTKARKERAPGGDVPRSVRPAASNTAQRQSPGNLLTRCRGRKKPRASVNSNGVDSARSMGGKNQKLSAPPLAGC